jgi:hypothetical protein
MSLDAAALDAQALDSFRASGYLALGQLFSAAELRRYQALFDRDWQERPKHWYRPGLQSMNCDTLITAPAFDDVIRHPQVLAPVAQLMGDPTCFSEICIRHMAAFDGSQVQDWHRDHPHLLVHRYRVDHLQLMLYLTDVDETSHCLTISPEAADDEILEPADQLARRGSTDLHGAAGSAFLFNVSVLHTATVRPTRSVRKSVQVYYGHRNRPALSEDSVVPPSLWRDHSDAEVRAFYNVLGGKSQKYAERTAGRDQAPSSELAEIAIQLDVEAGKRKPPE